MTIPNGCDLSQYTPNEIAHSELRSELGLSEGTPIVGLIARFDPFKNHKGFIEAAGHLKEVSSAIHFLLAGSGVDWDNGELVEWIRAEGLEAHIHLLGNRRDIPYLTAALDIATCCSWSEAFPNVVCEAMACGVPCVVTDVGDSAYIVGNTGIVVPVGDNVALAAAWHEILSMAKENRIGLGTLARRRIAENFEIISIVRQFEGLYWEAVKNAKKKSRSKCNGH